MKFILNQNSGVEQRGEHKGDQTWENPFILSLEATYLMLIWWQHLVSITKPGQLFPLSLKPVNKPCSALPFTMQCIIKETINYPR